MEQTVPHSGMSTLVSQSSFCCSVKMNKRGWRVMCAWWGGGPSGEESFTLMILRRVWKGVQRRTGSRGGGQTEDVHTH